MEFLRQVSVLFFIAGIFCDDGLVISNLIINLEKLLCFHGKYIYFYHVRFILTRFFYLFFYRVLDIEFPSLSVNAPQNGDIILQVTFYYIYIFFLKYTFKSKLVKSICN